MTIDKSKLLDKQMSYRALSAIDKLINSEELQKLYSISKDEMRAMIVLRIELKKYLLDMDK